MKEYKTHEVEAKWQKYWEDNKTFRATNGGKKPPYYILVEFPYPSGAGLHVGHVRSYTAQDTLARMKRMQGFNVLYPMGWDAFGAPAEEYAIKNHIHPKQAVQENIKTFKSQMMNLGISFDWDREFSTTDPDYYKWTQWQFLQFYKHGKAYKDTVPVNWCPKCKTVLSNEDSAGGVCERCGSVVVQKLKSQWMLKMSEYAEDLLDGLKDINFADKVKMAQTEWIGKSVGVQMKVKTTDGGEFEIFTTCIETIYGITFFVIAPDGKIIKDLMPKITNKAEVEDYIKLCATKSNLERKSNVKDKSGVELKGIKAINPVNGKEVPIYAASFVLGDYGTGAAMAVPTHDQRDFEFAVEHNISMIQVIGGADVSEKAFEKHSYLGKKCRLMNSAEFDGLTVEQAKEAITAKLQKMGIAKVTTNYRLRDWIFSRQRFWGEPIPLVHCEKCGWVPLDEKDLPLLLPDVAEYEPTDTGESPLAKITDWVNTTCPHCGGPAKRETDTMPNWAGSCWYFLRFMDPHNDKEFVSEEAMKYWGKVNWYNGGMEHAARHLLYARYWVQFLYNIGLVPYKEMIDTRVSHGMVLGSNNEKMSKSKGNVINPDDIVNQVGADTLRIYEMFMGDYQQDAPWSTDSLKGCKRFIDKVIKLSNKVIDGTSYSNDLESLIHKTIKKVTYDLSHMAYNTAVSSLMILTNAMDSKEQISKADYRLLLTLLNPLAPHITEELNEELGYDPICLGEWPVCDESKTVENTVDLPVQVLGKVRGTISVSKDASQDEAVSLACENENINKFITGDIKKVIYVPGRILNIIV
ncbi:MAG: leucine--tRNA ligase [Clostridia bacterium]|nr:leucine--tRNA ligase [Clostridia bacterium]